MLKAPTRNERQIQPVMFASAEITFDVPFHDVDMMHIVWHGHYYKYFELARTALFRKFNCDGPRLYELGYVLPIVESQCRYLSPLTYGMQVQATATLSEMEYRVKIHYALQEVSSGKRLARGSTTQVAVKREPYELCFMIPKVITTLFREEPCGS